MLSSSIQEDVVHSRLTMTPEDNTTTVVQRDEEAESDAEHRLH